MGVEAPVHLVLGDESLLVRQEEERLVASVFPDGRGGWNLATFSAEAGADDAIAIACTMPMMAARRVVVVRQVELASVDLLTALGEYSQNPNPKTLLVLSGAKLPGGAGQQGPSKRLEAAVKRHGRVVRFSAKDQDPVRFAQQRAEVFGATLERDAAKLLVELVGRDLSLVGLQVDKAATYVGMGGRIDVAVVEEVVSLVADVLVWGLTDAIVSRNLDDAIAQLHRLLEHGDSGESHRVLGLVTWQARQMLVAQECFRTGRDLREAGLNLPPFKVDRLRTNLRNLPLDDARVLGVLATANRDFHESKVDERRTLESLVLRLLG